MLVIYIASICVEKFSHLSTNTFLTSLARKYKSPKCDRFYFRQQSVCLRCHLIQVAFLVSHESRCEFDKIFTTTELINEVQMNFCKQSKLNCIQQCIT